MAAAWVSGLAVLAMIYALGHISAAHFNPAVTLGFAVAGRFPWRYVLPYWIAEFLGGIAAAALAALFFGGGHGVHIPAAGPLLARGRRRSGAYLLSDAGHHRRRHRQARKRRGSGPGDRAYRRLRRADWRRDYGRLHEPGAFAWPGAVSAARRRFPSIGSMSSALPLARLRLRFATKTLGAGNTTRRERLTS